MRIGPIPTINKEFSLHTRERDRIGRLGLEHALNKNLTLTSSPPPKIEESIVLAEVMAKQVARRKTLGEPLRRCP